jgi:hypothetical protein
MLEIRFASTEIVLRPDGLPYLLFSKGLTLIVQLMIPHFTRGDAKRGVATRMKIPVFCRGLASKQGPSSDDLIVILLLPKQKFATPLNLLTRCNSSYNILCQGSNEYRGEAEDARHNSPTPDLISGNSQQSRRNRARIPTSS